MHTNYILITNYLPTNERWYIMRQNGLECLCKCVILRNCNRNKLQNVTKFTPTHLSQNLGSIYDLEKKSAPIGKQPNFALLEEILKKELNFISHFAKKKN